MTSATSRIRRALTFGLVGGLCAATLGVVSGPAAANPGPITCLFRTNDTPEKLMECVSLAGVREHQLVFQAIAHFNDDTRSSGTPGYNATVDYAAFRLRLAGYDVTVQPFEFEFFDDDSTLEQVSPTPTEYEVFSAQFDPPFAGEATGVLTPVDVVIPPGPVANSNSSGCEAADFAAFPIGGIALMQRGTCAFTQKALNAQAARASAVVLFNEGQQPDRVGGIIPIGPAPGLTIPVVASDFATGEALYNATLGDEDVIVHVNAEFLVEERTTENIIAETRGGDDTNVVMVGGHLDSVLEGPGINDNGSGAATVLEVAEAMRRVRPNNTVRFALWGAEEFGLLGSAHYVSSLTPEELDSIALYLNFDMIGSPNYVRFVYDGDNSLKTPNVVPPPGSEAIEQLFTGFYDSRGLASEETAFDGRSDYGPFIDAGIPSGGLFTGAEVVKTAEQQAIYGGTAGEQFDPCYHEACDTFRNVALDVLDLNADAVAFATMSYATSTEGIGDAPAAAAAARASASTFVDQFGEHLAA